MVSAVGIVRMGEWDCRNITPSPFLSSPILFVTDPSNPMLSLPHDQSRILDKPGMIWKSPDHEKRNQVFSPFQQTKIGPLKCQLKNKLIHFSEYQFVHKTFSPYRLDIPIHDKILFLKQSYNHGFGLFIKKETPRFEFVKQLLKGHPF